MISVMPPERRLVLVQDLTTPAGYWIVRILPPGAAFRADDSQINESGQPLIEFFDPRFPHVALHDAVFVLPHGSKINSAEEGLAGEVVARYALDKFMEFRGDLTLYAGVEGCRVSAQALENIQEMVAAVTDPGFVSQGNPPRRTEAAEVDAAHGP